MKTTTRIIGLAALVVSVLSLSGCNCGVTHLVTRPEPRPFTDAGQPDAGGAFCGNALVEAPEECDFGLEENGGASCTADCKLPRTCEVGFVWDENTMSCVAVPPGGAFVSGTVYQYAGAIPPSPINPNVPIEGAVVHVRLWGQTADVRTFTTLADGKFRIDVSPGVQYGIHVDVPARYYSESDSIRQVLPLMNGETGNYDHFFLLKGIGWVVRDAVTGVAIPGVDMRIVNEANQLLSGPVLSDADGYGHLESTTQEAKLVLTKIGYRTDEYKMPSLNSTHTVVGGCILTPTP